MLMETVKYFLFNTIVDICLEFIKLLVNLLCLICRLGIKNMEEVGVDFCYCSRILTFCSKVS